MAASMVNSRLPCLSLLRHVEHARALLSPCSSRVYSSVESYEQGGAQEQQQDQPGNSEQQLRQSLLDGALCHTVSRRRAAPLRQQPHRTAARFFTPK